MKVLNIIQRYPPAIGGAEMWCQGICHYLVNRGCDVTVLTLDVYNEDEFWIEPPVDNCLLRFGKLEYDNNVRVVRCKRTKISKPFRILFRLIEKFLKIYLYGPHSFEMYKKMWPLIKNTDIVHLHTIPYPHNLFALIVAKIFKKKVVITPHFHVGHHYYELWSNFYLLKKCDAIFSVTEQEKEYFIKKNIGKDKVFVARNAINPKEYEANNLDKYKQEIFTKYNINEGSKIIIFIGRKIEYKGVDTLIDAAKIINKKMDIKLFLVGPDFNWFKEYYYNLSDADKKYIIDFGVVSNQEKINLLHMSDVLALPSKHEAFGIVFLEAWVCNIPVIGVDNGPVADVIGECGFTINYGDVEDLAKKIETLLMDKKLSLDMAKKGKEKAYKKYSWDIMGKNVLSVYSQLVSLQKEKTKSGIENIIKDGWYDVENNGFEQWVWSKKEAVLQFRKNRKGFSLTFSGCADPKIKKDILLSVYNKKDKLLKEYKIAKEKVYVSIPPKEKTVKIKLDSLWTDGERELGVCLHKIDCVREYEKICSWNPSIFEIETTTACNMNPACVMCDWRVQHGLEKQQFMDEGLIQRLKLHLDNADVASFHGVGEPLMNPLLFRIIGMFDANNTRTMFNSNGVLLSKQMAEKIIDIKLKEINFSIDAANDKTYKKIRRKDLLDKVKENIKYLAHLKEKYNSSYPKILINMTMMKENINELPQFIDMAKELSAQAVFVRLLKKIDKNYEVKEKDFCFNYFDQVVARDYSNFNQIIKEAKIKAKELGIELLADEHKIVDVFCDLKKAVNQDKDKKDNIQIEKNEFSPKCSRPWQNIIVSADGNVRFCCHTNALLGNLKKQSFEQIWNGEIAQNIREKFLENNIPQSCRTCPIHDWSGL